MRVCRHNKLTVCVGCAADGIILVFERNINTRRCLALVIRYGNCIIIIVKSFAARKRDFIVLDGLIDIDGLSVLIDNLYSV